MAWTAPKTWIVGAILAAGELNTHLRDNLAYLKGVVSGTEADKVPPTALDLTGTATLPIRRSPGVGDAAGNTAEVAHFRADNSLGNANTLRAILRRIAAGAGWQGTRWRLAHDIDNGASVPAFFDLGTDSAGGGYIGLGTGGVERLTIGATGDVDVPAGFLRARKNGAYTYAGGDGLVTGWNKSAGSAEVNWYNDRTLPGVAFAWSVWTGSAWRDVLTVDSSGKLTGFGIFRSAEVAIAAGAASNIAHGLGVIPSLVWGKYGSTSGLNFHTLPLYQRGNLTNPAATVILEYANTTEVRVFNNTAATIYCSVTAVL